MPAARRVNPFVWRIFLLFQTTNSISKDTLMMTLDSKFSIFGFVILKVFSYSKNEDTQLQFIFDAVPVSNEFPYGSRMTYRAYSCDVVYEIAECGDRNSVGFEPRRIVVGTFPERGTYLLRAIPNRLLRPAPFVPDSRATLEKFIAKFKSEFQVSQAQAVEEWLQFNLCCPRSDDSTKYESRMCVPFNNILFSSASTVSYNRMDQANLQVVTDKDVEMFAGHPIRVFQTTASVTHHNRGERRPTRPQPRIEILPNGTVTNVNDAVSLANCTKMKVSDLKKALADRGLSTHGVKAVLLARLETALANNLETT